MRRAPDVRPYGVDGVPVGPAFGGCLGRAVLLGLFFLLSLVATGLLAGGPLLEILLSILLSQ